MKNGFTLIELLTVVFIIGVMSMIIFVNYRNSGEKFALQRSANSLLQSIRMAEGMATNSQKFGTAYPSGGYGISLTKGSGSTNYTVFADVNNPPNHSYDIGEEVGGLGKFESSVKVSGLLPGVAGDNLTIIFQAPDPKVIFYGDSGEISTEITDVSIILTNPKNNETKTVKINKAGLIYVE